MRLAIALSLLGCLGAPIAGADSLKLPEAATGKALNAVWFADAKNGFIVGEHGLLLASADGGATWTRRESGSGATLRDVRFKDAKHGWACGDGDPAAPECRVGHVLMGPGIKNLDGTVLITADGGKTWANSWVASAFELPAIEVSTAPAMQLGVGGAHGHIDGDILRSGDGGKSWMGDRAYRGLFDLRAIDARRWIAVGAPVMVGFMPAPTSPLYLQKGCRALVSKDGGVTWAPSKGSDGSGKAILRGAAVKAGMPAIAVGDQGTILISADGGDSWKESASGTQENLTAVAYSAGKSEVAVAVGTKGTALSSTDKGATWKALGGGSGSTANLMDVCPAGEGFVAVGDGGTALRLDAKDLPAAAGK